MAGLAGLLADCLSRAAATAAITGDRASCHGAAHAAETIRQLMARDDVTPTLGEFLHPAAAHLTAAVSSASDLPYDARDAVTRELGRVVTTLARYLGDLPLPDEFDPALDPALRPAARAGAEARQALQWAAASLLPDPVLPEDTGGGGRHPVARHLADAADLLSAGRDLLHTHFTGTPSAHSARSYWAPVILSWPFTDALLTETAACARLLAPWTAHLSVTGPSQPGEPAGQRHPQACTSPAAGYGQPVQPSTRRTRDPSLARGPRADDRHPAERPARRPPAHEARASPPAVPGHHRSPPSGSVTQPGHSLAAPAGHPKRTSLSWRRDALASAITTHSSAFILRMLTQRAEQLGLDAALQAQLRTATTAMNMAGSTWYKTARQWDLITTGQYPPGSITPVAAEIGELALRTGRLARRDPHWTPARTGLGLIRDPASLAPTPGDFPAVIAAVHHAADAIVRVAAEDRQAIREAAADRRLYLPARLLPAKHQTPYPHAPIPWPRARHLLSTYTGAIQATTRALATLDTLATTTTASSQILSRIRALSPAPSTQQRPPTHAHKDRTRHARSPPVPSQAPSLKPSKTSPSATPQTLLRAAVIDQAARDLAARASAQAQRRPHQHHTSSPAQDTQASQINKPCP